MAGDIPSQVEDARHFLVSLDFATTVTTAKGPANMPDYSHRPVHWVLARRATRSGPVTHLMAISPFEAQELLAVIKKATLVSLHLYIARCNAGHRTFDQLDFLTIPKQERPLQFPPLLLMQLNVFAGQLYFSSFDHYQKTCEFLGIASGVAKAGEVIAADGFIMTHSDGTIAEGSSPLKFLQGWLSKIRRNNESIAKTHLGGIIDGKVYSRAELEWTEEASG